MSLSFQSLFPLQRVFRPLHTIFSYKYISPALKHESKQPLWFSWRLGTPKHIPHNNRQDTLQSEIVIEKTIDTTLHEAADLNQHEKLRKLIFESQKTSLSLDVPNKDGLTPLMLAIAKKRYGPLSLLLDAGANLFEVIPGTTSSAFEVAQKQPALICFLANRGYLSREYRSRRCQKSIISKEDLESIKEAAFTKAKLQDQFFELIEAGRLVNIKAFWKVHDSNTQNFLLSTTNDQGETAFLRAVIRGYRSTAQFLLNQGADRFAITYSGENAMDFAVMCGDEPMMRLLLIQK